MLTFHYGSFFHILALLFAAGLIVGMFFLFRKKSAQAKLWFLYALSAVNIIQHLLKFLIWPHVWGSGFSYVNTAYNVCAILILLTPFFLCKRQGAWRETISYVGTFGCTLSLLVPYWFAGRSLAEFEVGWEYVRFLCCHILLLCTSLLPVLWGMVQFRLKNFWKIGLCFFALLGCILINDIVCICTGLTDGSAETMYETLCALNPLWMMHPPEGFEVYIKLITALSPALFLGGKSGVYTPILWYFVPLYLGITLLAIPLGYLAERYLGGKHLRKFLQRGGEPQFFL